MVLLVAGRGLGARCGAGRSIFVGLTVLVPVGVVGVSSVGSEEEAAGGGYGGEV